MSDKSEQQDGAPSEMATELSLQNSWRKAVASYKKRSSIWIAAFLAIFVPTAIQTIVSYQDADDIEVFLQQGDSNVAMSALFGLLAGVASLVVGIAITRYALAESRGEKTVAETGEFFRSGIPGAAKLFFFTIFMSLMIIGGLILLIIPGILVIFWSFFAWTAVIDRRGGFMEMFRLSKTMVQANRSIVLGLIGMFFLYGIVFSILNAMVSLILPSSSGLVLGNALSTIGTLVASYIVADYYVALSPTQETE